MTILGKKSQLTKAYISIYCRIAYLSYINNNIL